MNYFLIIGNVGTEIFDDCFYRVTEFQVSEIRESTEQLETGTTIQSFETTQTMRSLLEYNERDSEIGNAWNLE